MSEETAVIEGERGQKAKGLRQRRIATAELLAHVIREEAPMPLDDLVATLKRLSENGIIDESDSLVDGDLLRAKTLGSKQTIIRLREAAVPKSFIAYLRESAARSAKSKDTDRDEGAAEVSTDEV